MTIFHSKSEHFRLTIFGVGTFLSTLILYLITAYPTVAYIDSGELAVSNWTLGIAHPTGYPLYTLVGRLFSLLPLELIKTQILFGALCTSLATAVLTVSLIRFLRTRSLQLQLSLSLTGVLIGTAPLVWSQGVTNEVYSLHLLMLALIVSLLINDYSPKNQILGGFIVGLSFGNHMSTVLLLPAIGYYLLVNLTKLKAAPRTTLTAFGLVALAASIYLYLPIRSAQDPIFNWGQPTSFDNFIRHVTGWQYQVWMFSRSPEELLKSLGNFASALFKQFPPPYWIAIIFGVWVALQKHRKTIVLLLLILAFNVIYSLNFSIPDIDNYFLPSVLVLYIFSTLGIAAFAAKSAVLDRIAPLLVASMLVWGLAANWSECDQSRNTSALDGVHNYYASIDDQALVLCADWDYMSPWLYSHFYLKERPDVIMVDNELARRSWYPDWIRHTDPELYRHIKSSTEAFLPHVRQFEAGKRYDPRRIEQTYRDLLLKIMQFPNRTLYYDHSVQLAIPVPGQVEVSGQLFRVVRAGETFVNVERKTEPPNFGKPIGACTSRELQHLGFYNLMAESRNKAVNPGQN